MRVVAIISLIPTIAMGIAGAIGVWDGAVRHFNPEQVFMSLLLLVMTLIYGTLAILVLT